MLRAFFQKINGDAVSFPPFNERSEIQQAFLAASTDIGMPRFDSTTIDEFMRRVELYQTYVVGFLYGEHGQVDITRKMLLDMLGNDYSAAITNVKKRSKREFDSTMAAQKAEYELANQIQQ